MLTYARGTFGTGCMHFKHGGIQWHMVRQKIVLSILKNLVRMVCTLSKSYAHAEYAKRYVTLG